jgi:hypothetical protein
MKHLLTANTLLASTFPCQLQQMRIDMERVL